MKDSRKTASLRHQRYARFVYWVRKSHGWIGLWGAMLGLIFGLSGIWLNHRAVLKLPPVAQQRNQVQIALPVPPPSTPEAMSSWLQSSLQLDAAPTSMRVEASREVPWGTLRQPERWQFNFGGPSELVQVEYWGGNTSVKVNVVKNGLIATLTNLHKGSGMSIPWILLVDSIAFSMIFLSLSGVILWIQMNRRRAIGAGILSVSVALSLTLIGVRL